MFKHLLLATALTVATVGIASAAPISGSFSLASFSGSYVGGTAATATGLDFGTVLGGSGMATAPTSAPSSATLPAALPGST